MKSFLLNIKRSNTKKVIAYTTLVVSNKINVTNEYMLFDDGFVRKEHASYNEPECITVYDSNGDCLGNYVRSSNLIKDNPCVWALENDPNKELIIRRLKAITEPSTAKEYNKWLDSQRNIPQDKLAYLKGEAYKDGIGVIKNFLKASKEFRAGVDAGNSACKVAYADLLLKGWFGQQPDTLKAITFLESAIEDRNLFAKSCLAELYLNNPKLSEAVDTAIKMGCDLLDSSEEFISDHLIMKMIKNFSDPKNKFFNKEKTIDLLSLIDSEVNSKELAFLIIESDQAGKIAARAKIEKKAFAFIENEKHPDFDYGNNYDDMVRRNADRLRQALLVRCHRLGIGTIQDVSKCLKHGYFSYINFDQYPLPNANAWGEEFRKVEIRWRYENLLAAIDIAMEAINSQPFTDKAYWKYGDLLKHLTYLDDYAKEGMPHVNEHRNELAEFIKSLDEKYKTNYQRLEAEQNRREEAAKQQGIRNDEERRKQKEAEEEQKRKQAEAEKEQRRLEAEKKRAEWLAEKAEKLRSGVIVDVRFDYKCTTQLDDDDFDDSPTVFKSEYSETLQKEEYLALLSGGERAIKAYVQAFCSDKDWGSVRTIVISATMTKIS